MVEKGYTQGIISIAGLEVHEGLDIVYKKHS